jgi:hypothetical protein
MNTLVPEKFPTHAAEEEGQFYELSEVAVEEDTRLIRQIIWLYLILWLVEGGLRRWFLPGLAGPLLLIRDPLVVAIYCLAIAKNIFPFNAFVVSGAFLAILTFFNAVELGHGNAYVALYGVRCDFLHVPLIFIMGRVLTQKDILAMAKVAVWIAVPYTALLVAQFYEPQSAWVNRGVGGSLEGAGFDGALDRFRPPGTFSFISGPAHLYPILTACWFTLLLTRKLPVWLMLASGISILLAVPISISRTLFIGVVIVAIVGLIAMMVGGRFSIKLALQVTVAAILIPLIAAQSLAFKDGMEAFGARWEDATTDQGGFKGAIVDRMLKDLFGAFGDVQGSGCGTGFSTNVGQQLVTQRVGFGAAEAEWGRLLYDNGFVWGGMLVVYRIGLACLLVVAGLKAWRHRSPFGLIFASACLVNVLTGQWGQATSLGSSIIGGGLALAASNTETAMPEEFDEHSWNGADS